MELLCPVCGAVLIRQENRCICENRHSFDVARQGYVNLLTVQQKHSLHPGDTREQVISRRAFLEGGFYEHIVAELKENALEADPDTAEKLELAARIGRKILEGREVELP